MDKIKTIILLLLFTLFGLSGCDFKKVEKGNTPPKSAMKCGAGKCGANMFDGNSALVKKKKNILSQMREDDSRKDCVIKASTTKAVYDCVRDPKGKKLIMKCETGKCGNNTKELSPKKQPAMKCGAGKCGSSM